MSEWTLALAFCAGLLPTAGLSLCVLALFRVWCIALKGERDALKQACDELARRNAAVMAENTELRSVRLISQTIGVTPIEQDRGAAQEPKVPAQAACAQTEADLARFPAQERELEAALGRQMEYSKRLERELAQLRQEYCKLQDVLAREKERIGRTLRKLKAVREAWLISRRPIETSNG